VYFYSFTVTQLQYRMEGTGLDFLEDLTPLSQALVQTAIVPPSAYVNLPGVSLLSMPMFVSRNLRQGLKLGMVKLICLEPWNKSERPLCFRI